MFSLLRFPLVVCLILLAATLPAVPGHAQNDVRDHDDIDLREARAIAMCESGEIIPPEDLSLRIKRQLSGIRSKFKNEVLQGLPRYQESQGSYVLSVEFDPSEYRRVLDGSYSEWDELNDSYSVARISFHSTTYHVAYLNFGPGSGRLINLCALAREYVKLPGVRRAEPAPIPVIPEAVSHGIVSHQADRYRAYLFYGCGMSKPGYWYFKVENETERPSFIGYFERSDWGLKGPVEYPEWWDEAQSILEFRCGCDEH